MLNALERATGVEISDSANIILRCKDSIDEIDNKREQLKSENEDIIQHYCKKENLDQKDLENINNALSVYFEKISSISQHTRSNFSNELKKCTINDCKVIMPISKDIDYNVLQDELLNPDGYMPDTNSDYEDRATINFYSDKIEIYQQLLSIIQTLGETEERKMLSLLADCIKDATLDPISTHFKI